MTSLRSPQVEAVEHDVVMLGHTARLEQTFDAQGNRLQVQAKLDGVNDFLNQYTERPKGSGLFDSFARRSDSLTALHNRTQKRGMRERRLRGTPLPK